MVNTKADQTDQFKMALYRCNDAKCSTGSSVGFVGFPYYQSNVTAAVPVWLKDGELMAVFSDDRGQVSTFMCRYAGFLNIYT